MAKRTKEISIEDFLRDNLQAKVRNEVGRRTLEQTKLPDYFDTSLNPYMKLRPYQREAFQYFINYWENDFEGKPAKPQLLFHMATGSGKTLIMAGAILYLFEKGYRNFLFFVNSGNVIEKTKDNFFNVSSAKYQFGSVINIGNKNIAVKQVNNFENADENNINLCLTTIQGLHIDLNTPKENAVTIEDFKGKKVVMIADEAHHINTATKRGEESPLQTTIDFGAGNGDWEGSDDWETTVMAIFNSNEANVLLEFTATEDFANPAIADKYKDKVLFDYPLKKFREDGYSKDIRTIQSDLQPIDRAIQAVLLSQFRRKLANSIRQEIKPVVMFKSRTIAANKSFYEEFVQTIRRLTAETLQRIKDNAHEDILDAFNYFDSQGILLDNLLFELQDDFKEDNLLLVDGNNITPRKQQQLNSLEAKDNEFRAVFAVDMLNEGWDVLNLYDIVRMYDTRDARQGVVGKTTNQEAQLIGRGARYMPFKDETQPDIAKEPMEEYNSKRKFDNDLGNNLRYLETLHYHSASNTRYIQELRTALIQTGIIENNRKEITERLKEGFKKTRLYKDGYVFANSQEQRLANVDITDIGINIKNKTFTVKINTGEMLTNDVFSKATPAEVSSLKQHTYVLGDFGSNILRSALNRFECYKFDSLSEIYPNLKSIKEFIESESYLACIRVTVYGSEEVVRNLTQKQKLYTTIEVLRQIEPLLSTGGIITIGAKQFIPRPFRDVFRTEHRYNVSVGGADKEDGVSMRETNDAFLRLDLSKEDWYVYDDNFGTSEEKFLIKYIKEVLPKLREKYDEVYLVRNYKDVRIFNFTDGRATEPDFVLFLRCKDNESRYDNVQIFIEPKGEHLRMTDKWKEVFELAIHNESKIHFMTPNDKFSIWGMPFFTNNHRQDFEKAMQEQFSI